MAKRAVRVEISMQTEDPRALDHGVSRGAGPIESDRLIAANPFGNPAEVLEPEIADELATQRRVAAVDMQQIRRFPR